MTRRTKTKLDVVYFLDVAYGFAAICAGVAVVATFVWMLS